MPDRLKPALPFLYALCLCALLSLVVAGRAEAHAALLASDPLDGAQLSLQPAAVELRFNEPVRPLMLPAFGNASGVVLPSAGDTTPLTPHCTPMLRAKSRVVCTMRASISTCGCGRSSAVSS